MWLSKKTFTATFANVYKWVTMRLKYVLSYYLMCDKILTMCT